MSGKSDIRLTAQVTYYQWLYVTCAGDLPLLVTGSEERAGLTFPKFRFHRYAVG